MISLTALSCKKPYDPPEIQFPGSYLVVEGVVNSGGDSTIIHLNRTVALTTGHTDNPVFNAVVTVESDQGSTSALTDMGNGKYASPSVPIDKSLHYRLHIKTGQKEYLSDFVAVQTTPPIDSVGFSIKNNGLQVYANTHDPTNAVQYYRWDYDEAWEFHSFFESQYILKNGTDIVPRLASEQVYYCFNSDVSSDIALATTTNLKQNVLNEAPVALIPASSEKLEMRYSILVRQYALTGDAYSFYARLKKNTESLGSIFDAQPSEIKGNIHSTTDASEPVIGYVSVSNVTSKRVFISNYMLPQTWHYESPYGCLINPLITPDILNTLRLDPSLAYFLSPSTLGSPICSNCSLRGTFKAPSFWVY